MLVCNGLRIATQTRSLWCGQSVGVSFIHMTVVSYQLLHVDLFGDKRKIFSASCESIHCDWYTWIAAAWNKAKTMNEQNPFSYYLLKQRSTYSIHSHGLIKNEEWEWVVCYRQFTLHTILHQWVSLIIQRVTIKLSCAALLLSLAALCTMPEFDRRPLNFIAS